MIKRKKLGLLGEVVSKYYKKTKQIIAVTGTNEVFSSRLFYQLLNNNKIPVASIGTLGIKFKKSSAFTPYITDIISLHKNLQFLKKNIDHVIIEASSHGLSQRLNNLKFKAGNFTNLIRSLGLS